MFESSRAGHSRRSGAQRSPWPALLSVAGRTWPVRNGGRKNVTASSWITTRMRRTARHRRRIRCARCPMRASLLHCAGMKLPTVIPPRLRSPRCRNASRRLATLMPAWIRRRDRSTFCSNSRRGMRPRVSETLPGRPTSARWKARRRESRRRGLSRLPARRQSRSLRSR